MKLSVQHVTKAFAPKVVLDDELHAMFVPLIRIRSRASR